MPDLLFEIGVEELPSWYVDEGRAALALLFEERLAQAGLTVQGVRGRPSPTTGGRPCRWRASRSATRRA